MNPSAEAQTAQAAPGPACEFGFALVATDPLERGIAGIDTVTEALFAAGCDDATPSFQHGVYVVDFDRAARNFVQAVASALEDVRAAGLRPLRVEPDEVVNAAEIARRAAVSRQAVHKWFRELPAPPAPAHGATGATPLYDWIEIARWLHANGQVRISVRDVVRARLTKRINRALAAAPERGAATGFVLGKVVDAILRHGRLPRPTRDEGATPVIPSRAEGP